MFEHGNSDADDAERKVSDDSNPFMRPFEDEVARKERLLARIAARLGVAREEAAAIENETDDLRLPVDEEVAVLEAAQRKVQEQLYQAWRQLDRTRSEAKTVGSGNVIARWPCSDDKEIVVRAIAEGEARLLALGVVQHWDGRTLPTVRHLELSPQQARELFEKLPGVLAQIEPAPAAASESPPPNGGERSPAAASPGRDATSAWPGHPSKTKGKPR